MARKEREKKEFTREKAREDKRESNGVHKRESNGVHKRESNRGSQGGVRDWPGGRMLGVAQRGPCVVCWRPRCAVQGPSSACPRFRR